ncbi:MAG: hypothetical protein ICV83_04065, partial [Cytophagales bacterium]|nr:hypothetical protein [Cytophagales bacterium]
MATVLLGIYPAFSHLNASFKVARHLKDSGYRVVYADSTDDFAEVIVMQGFEFVKIDTGQFPRVGSERYGLPAFVAAYVNERKQVREMNRFLLQRRMYDQVIREVRPDLLIIDALLSPFILLLLPYKIPVFTLQTMFPTEKAQSVPPLHSTIVPDGSRWATLRIKWAWWKYFAGRKLRQYANQVRCMGTAPTFENVALLKQFARLEDRSLDDFICFRRTLTFRLQNIAELVTSPRELDFPRSPDRNQYFLGGSIDVSRAEAGIDANYAEAMAKLAQERGDKYKFLIYCAFGTMNPQKSKQFLSFLRRLMRAFELNRDWQLVLAAGKQFEPVHLGALPANVCVFGKIPQLDILQRAD